MEVPQAKPGVSAAGGSPARELCPAGNGPPALLSEKRTDVAAPPDTCRACHRRPPAEWKVCSSCFNAANGVLSDVEWMEDFVEQFVATLSFASRFGRLDEDSFDAMTRGFAGYPEYVTPFRRATDRILRYASVQLPALNSTRLNAAPEAFTDALELPLLTHQMEGFSLSEGERRTLRVLVVEVRDVLRQVRQFLEGVRLDYFVMHEVTCGCPDCRKMEEKTAGATQVAEPDLAAPLPVVPPPGVGGAGGTMTVKQITSLLSDVGYDERTWTVNAVRKRLLRDQQGLFADLRPHRLPGKRARYDRTGVRTALRPYIEVTKQEWDGAAMTLREIKAAKEARARWLQESK